jgi:orotidine-5'-phosphate decarboxylase
MLNVHALGGRAMLSAAREALEITPLRPKLIAVTVLTSMQDADLTEVGIDGGAQQAVARLSQLTQDCGLDGVVCSAREAIALRRAHGKDFLLLTPGIRPAQAEPGDQARIATPREALQNGVNYLVIGRPITQAPDPLAALEAILQEIQLI